MCVVSDVYVRPVCYLSSMCTSLSFVLVRVSALCMCIHIAMRRFGAICSDGYLLCLPPSLFLSPLICCLKRVSDRCLVGGSPQYYSNYVNALRTLFATDTSKTYYVTAAPQCPYP